MSRARNTLTFPYKHLWENIRGYKARARNISDPFLNETLFHERNERTPLTNRESTPCTGSTSAQLLGGPDTEDNAEGAGAGAGAPSSGAAEAEGEAAA